MNIVTSIALGIALGTMAYAFVLCIPAEKYDDWAEQPNYLSWMILIDILIFCISTGVVVVMLLQT